MQKKKSKSITREEILTTKIVSFEERKRLFVTPPNYITMRQAELKMEKCILKSLQKAKNNLNMPLRNAFKKEITSLGKQQYYEIMKYIEYILDRLEVYNKNIYYIRQKRRLQYGNKYGIIDFDDLSDDEVNELFKLYMIRLEENYNI